MPVDRQSMIPLHLQICNMLKEEIKEGVYSDKIPSEFDLMAKFSVSRSTIRQAIQTLVDEGVLEKKHGVGTFIVSRPVEEWLGNLTSYFDIVNDMGMRPDIKLLEQGFTGDDKAIQRILGEKKYFYIYRLRYADHIPVGFEKQYYPVSIGLELDKCDLNNVSTYQILETRLGRTLSHAKQLITVAMANEQEKELLKLGCEVPCALLSERFVYDSDANILEYEKTMYRADIYSFCIHLSRKRTL